MILPALPPPDRATNNANLEIFMRLPTSRAIGATIKTATGINTPTAVMIIVASASDKIAHFSPNLVTIALAMAFAAPDSIMTPAKTPAASTLTTVPITLCVPATTILTVWLRLEPPIMAPKIVPSNNE